MTGASLPRDHAPAQTNAQRGAPAAEARPFGSRALPLALVGAVLAGPLGARAEPPPPRPAPDETARRQGAAAEGASSEEVLRWSEPEIAVPGELVDWSRRNAAQLGRVERAWAALLRRLAGDQPGYFESQCEAFAESMRRLDESLLLPVPEPLLDLHMKRLVAHLRGASAACQAGQLFNVVYHLEEARLALVEIRRLLERRFVAPRRDTPP